MRHARVAFLVLLATAALALPASAFAADPGKGASGHTITVYGANGGKSAEFTSATCKVSPSGKGFHAKATSANGFNLFVTIFAFDDFGEYQVEQGPIDPNPGILVDADGDLNDPKNLFANYNVPAYPSFAFGSIVFKREDDGTLLMGVGYGPAMYSSDLSTAIFLTGVVPCEKKKPKPKKPKPKPPKPKPPKKPGKH